MLVQASAIAGKAEVGAIAADAIGGPRLRQAVSVLVALALFTSISAMVMAGPRVYARMAEDGLFPRIFGPGRRGAGERGRASGGTRNSDALEHRPSQAARVHRVHAEPLGGSHASRG